MPQGVDLLAHRTAVANDAARPFQHPLPLRRETLKTRAAIDEQHAHLLLELFHPGRKRWLCDAASLGGAPKMPLPRESQDEFKLVDQRLISSISAKAGVGLLKN